MPDIVYPAILKTLVADLPDLGRAASSITRLPDSARRGGRQPAISSRLRDAAEADLGEVVA
jgi:hypothetical protein